MYNLLLMFISCILNKNFFLILFIKYLINTMYKLQTTIYLATTNYSKLYKMVVIRIHEVLIAYTKSNCCVIHI